jgi:hypothetical protein
MTQEGALHLILIFDYIADWAKESYRPSVLKQLTSLATGEDFDRIVLESDVGVVPHGKPVPLLTTSAHQDIQMDEEPEVSDGSDGGSVHVEEHSNVNFLHMPTSDYGTIRPMNTAVFRCTGLRITKDNATAFLPSGLGEQIIGACARELLHQITRWEDILVVAAADLGDLEVLWTGGEPSSFHKHDHKSDVGFFVKFQYRCFIDLSWRTIRELTYLAISPSALPVLTKLAASQRKLPGLYSISERLLPCSGATLRETISCIRSGHSGKSCAQPSSALRYIYIRVPQQGTVLLKKLHTSLCYTCGRLSSHRSSKPWGQSSQAAINASRSAVSGDLPTAMFGSKMCLMMTSVAADAWLVVRTFTPYGTGMAPAPRAVQSLYRP